MDQDTLDQIDQIKDENKPINEFNIEVHDRICNLLKKCKKIVYIKDNNDQIYFYVLCGAQEFNQLIKSKKEDITTLLDQYGTDLDVDEINQLLDSELVKVLIFKDSHFQY